MVITAVIVGINGWQEWTLPALDVFDKGEL
jgi:hypothetical protein